MSACSVLLGMGSNIEPERYLKQAAIEIRERYPDARFSSVYRSAAVGMEGDDFLNACCLLSQVEDVAALKGWLKSMEDRCGRDRSEGSWKPRTLDLDILRVGEAVPEGDLLCYAHAYIPASELIDIQVPDMDKNVITRLALRL